MAQLNKADEIAAVWKALATNPSSEAGWRTLPIATGELWTFKAGRHYPGNEEAILAGFASLSIPLKDPLPEGKGFSIRLVSLGYEHDGLTWVALQRQPLGSIDMFSHMVSDVVSSLQKISASAGQSVFKSFLSRVRAWQDFMQRGKEGVLSFESEVGLFGELIVLESLINSGIEPSTVVNFWIGPCDGLQDFQLGTGAIEVKTTTTVGTFIARISSLDQLDDHQYQPIFLAAVRINQHETGMTLPEKVEIVRELIEQVNSEAIIDFELRLLQAGYYSHLSNSYTRRFKQTEKRLLKVTDDFPRLLRGTVPNGVQEAKYDIDLDTIRTDQYSLDQALTLLGVTCNGAY